MKSSLSSLALLIALLQGLAACGSTEKPLTLAYFQGLGPENTSVYLKECVAQKKPLLERKDAAGLDQFAQSVRAGNCRMAFQYAAEAGGQALMAQSARFEQATTAAEADGIRAQLQRDFDAQWGDLVSTFPEWKETASPLMRAVAHAESAFTRAKSRISIEALRNYGK